MIIDSHFHLEEELMPVDDILSAMDAHRIDKTALIASICHGISEPHPLMLNILRKSLSHSFTRRIIKPLCVRFTPDGNVKLPGSIATIYQEPDNSTVFDAVDKHPDRFLGWVFINPIGNYDPVAEFEKWKEHPGCIGVKTHPYWHQYRPIELKEIAQRAARADMPMLMHTGFDEFGDVVPLVRAVPDLKLIIAHAGFPGYADTWKKIKKFSNSYIDLSATPYVDETITRNVVSFLGPARCIFGTDGPFGSKSADGAFDYSVIKNRLKRLFPDERVQAKLLSENFKSFLKVPI